MAILLQNSGLSKQVEQFCATSCHPQMTPHSPQTLMNALIINIKYRTKQQQQFDTVSLTLAQIHHPQCNRGNITSIHVLGTLSTNHNAPLQRAAHYSASQHSQTSPRFCYPSPQERFESPLRTLTTYLEGRQVGSSSKQARQTVSLTLFRMQISRAVKKRLDHDRTAGLFQMSGFRPRTSWPTGRRDVQR